MLIKTDVCVENQYRSIYTEDISLTTSLAIRHKTNKEYNTCSIVFLFQLTSNKINDNVQTEHYKQNSC